MDLLIVVKEFQGCCIFFQFMQCRYRTCLSLTSGLTKKKKLKKNSCFTPLLEVTVHTNCFVLRSLQCVEHKFHIKLIIHILWYSHSIMYFIVPTLIIPLIDSFWQYIVLFCVFEFKSICFKILDT